MNDRCSIVEEPLSRLAESRSIPIRFEVQSVFQISGNDPRTAILTEVPVQRPWVKDYDALEGQGPESWSTRWDISNWGLLSAYVNGCRVAMCAVAHDTNGICLLEGRVDMAFLWDFRVHPEHRRRGIGRKLFDAAARWTKRRGCQELRVETQNINVPACQFYERQGCLLNSIDHSAYEMLPDEVQLIWRLML